MLDDNKRRPLWLNRHLPGIQQPVSRRTAKDAEDAKSHYWKTYVTLLSPRMFFAFSAFSAVTARDGRSNQIMRRNRRVTSAATMITKHTVTIDRAMNRAYSARPITS